MEKYVKCCVGIIQMFKAETLFIVGLVMCFLILSTQKRIK